MSETESGDSGTPELPPPPLRVLQLSTLLWAWNGTGPITVVVDNEPNETPIGRYSAGPTTRIVLDLDAPWSPEHSAFVYKLPEAQAPLTLRYVRRTYVGTIGSDITYYGTIAGVYSQGDSDTIGPALCVHRLDDDPFPETLVPIDGLRRGPGPPYDFIDFDWIQDGVQPDGIGVRRRALNLDVPDLPGQGEDDLEQLTTEDDIEIEEDGAELLGWSGDWVATLLEKRERGEDVGTRTEVRWRDIGRVQDSKWVDVRLWGVEVEFEAQDFEEHWPDRETPAGRRYLEGYTAVATIKRFFITPEWYTDATDEGASS